MTANVLVDANVLMELFFNRPKRDATVAAITSLTKDSIVCTSILSISVLLYFVETEKRDKTLAYSFLNGYKVLDMSEADFIWAQANDQGDFEDALQVSCALRHTCQKLLTLDKNLGLMYGKHVLVQTIR